MTQIINTLIDVIINIVNVILKPIDLIIEQFIPNINNFISGIYEFFVLIFSSISWVLDCFGLNSSTWTLLISYFTFKLSVPLVSYTIKLAIKWYNYLKT